MYEYKKRPSRLKNTIILTILVIVVAASSIFIYDMYTNINVYSSEQDQTSKAIRLSYEEQENGEENKNDITQVLENTVECVVGISKIKNKGNAILDSNATEELGLGSGIIVSENGYIVTNWHVAGNKYSSCYITLENGNTYNRKCCMGRFGFRFSYCKNKCIQIKILKFGRF